MIRNPQNSLPQFCRIYTTVFARFLHFLSFRITLHFSEVQNRKRGYVK